MKILFRKLLSKQQWQGQAAIGISSMSAASFLVWFSEYAFSWLGVLQSKGKVLVVESGWHTSCATDQRGVREGGAKEAHHTKKHIGKQRFILCGQPFVHCLCNECFV